MSRLLAFVLLALVFYAATAEATHRHGNLLVNRTGHAVTSPGASSGTDTSLKDTRALGDCLICQLQQQLSVTLFNSPPQITAPPLQAPPYLAAEISYLSQSDTPRRGRAPPLASLF
ncbi:MAG TPA: DUF2946 family protein [Pyrinomonadaceae bacterium]